MLPKEKEIEIEREIESEKEIENIPAAPPPLYYR